jgi:NAD-dependent deacetylase
MLDHVAWQPQLETARQWLLEAERVVALTGAGISTDSGIPDFRGPQGVWTKDPEAEAKSDISFYLGDPELRKRAWQRRVETAQRDPKPNSGHLALAELERRGRLHALVTQNIDGLHQLAGHDPERVVEIHGTMREVMCMSCGERAPMERALARVRAGEEDPPCRTCGGILKSAAISFGQQLIAEDILRAEMAARSCDLMLAIGSTLVVYPAAALVPIAKRNGARLVIVNGEETAYDDMADVVLRGPIGEILPALVGDASARAPSPPVGRGEDPRPDGTEAHL